MLLFTERLGPGELFVCANCETHLTKVSLLESKNFKGKTGPAYLIKNVWNCRKGPPEDRQLLTGEHTIQEIYCQQCEINIGWTYMRAFDIEQQYKIGKYILEKAYITKITDKAATPKTKKSSKKSKKKSSSFSSMDRNSSNETLTDQMSD